MDFFITGKLFYFNKCNEANFANNEKNHLQNCNCNCKIKVKTIANISVDTLIYILKEFASNYNNNRRGQTCGLALSTLNPFFNNNKFGQGLMVVDEVPDLFSFLLSNGYKIDTSLTKMMNGSDIRFQTENSNKVIAFITYNGY